MASTTTRTAMWAPLMLLALRQACARHVASQESESGNVTAVTSTRVLYRPPALQHTTDQEYATILDNAFTGIDVNTDGTMTVLELSAHMRRHAMRSFHGAGTGYLPDAAYEQFNVLLSYSINDTVPNTETIPLSTLLEAYGEDHLAEPDAKRTDVDKDGLITRDEFVGFSFDNMQEHRHDDDTEQDTFFAADNDGNAALSVDELDQAGLKLIQKPEEILAVFDRDGSKLLEMEEFITLTALLDSEMNTDNLISEFEGLLELFQTVADNTGAIAFDDYVREIVYGGSAIAMEKSKHEKFGCYYFALRWLNLSDANHDGKIQPLEFVRNEQRYHVEINLRAEDFINNFQVSENHDRGAGMTKKELMDGLEVLQDDTSHFAAPVITSFVEPLRDSHDEGARPIGFESLSAYDWNRVLDNLFARMDIDSDKKVDATELAMWLLRANVLHSSGKAQDRKGLLHLLDRKMIERQFNDFDSNHDSKVSVAEFDKVSDALHKALLEEGHEVVGEFGRLSHHAQSLGEARPSEKMWRKFDLDADGSLNMAEFTELRLKEAQASDQLSDQMGDDIEPDAWWLPSVHEGFTHDDKDQDGKVSIDKELIPRVLGFGSMLAEEVDAVLLEKDGPYTRHKSIARLADHTEDGFLSLVEYAEMMLSHERSNTDGLTEHGVASTAPISSRGPALFEFKRVDTDDDGSITAKEFSTHTSTILPGRGELEMRFGFTDQQSKKLKDLDHDKSNSLNVDEFVLYYYSTQHRFNYTAVGIIDTHDADHDKKLTRVELQSVEHGVPMGLLQPVEAMDVYSSPTTHDEL